MTTPFNHLLDAADHLTDEAYGEFAEAVAAEAKTRGQPYKILFTPMSPSRLRQVADERGWIRKVVVEVDLSDIVEQDLEGFINLLGKKVGSPCVCDVGWAIVGHVGDVLHISVTADVSADLQGEEE